VWGSRPRSAGRVRDSPPSRGRRSGEARPWQGRCPGKILPAARCQSSEGLRLLPEAGPPSGPPFSFQDSPAIASKSALFLPWMSNNWCARRLTFGMLFILYLIQEHRFKCTFVQIGTLAGRLVSSRLLPHLELLESEIKDRVLLSGPHKLTTSGRSSPYSSHPSSRRRFPLLQGRRPGHRPGTRRRLRRGKRWNSPVTTAASTW